MCLEDVSVHFVLWDWTMESTASHALGKHPATVLHRALNPDRKLS